MTWFVPMKEKRPWRQPLSERQASAVSRTSWPQLDPFARRTLDELMSHRTDSLGRVTSDYFPKYVPEDEEDEKNVVGLQVRARYIGGSRDDDGGSSHSCILLSA